MILWVKKNAKIEKGNLYLTENRLSKNEMRAAGNQNYMSHICAKRIFRFKSQIMQLLTKYQIFKKWSPNFTYSQKL